ncbi:MAG: hypothetical protein ABI333_27845 [bacterium]
MVEEEATVDEEELEEVPSRHKKPPPHPTRSGMVSCLRCETRFVSWDKTRNRLCPSCASRSW